MGAWKKSYSSYQQMLDDVHPDNGRNIDEGHQINETRRAALILAASGVCGSCEDVPEQKVTKEEFDIVLEGFSNTDHKPGRNDPKDFVSITVRQK